MCVIKKILKNFLNDSETILMLKKKITKISTNLDENQDSLDENEDSLGKELIF